MNSRFFKHLSESESESSEAESDTPAPVKTLATAYTFSDDDEEETKRVVRSTKDKRFEELQTLIKQARNHRKNKDIAKLLDGFEDLCRLYQKAKNFLDKDSDLATPRIYLRYLSELDQFTNDLWNDKDVKKNMSKNNSKSLAILRQKLRKYVKDFEAEIELYRANQDPNKDDSDENDSDASDKADDDDQDSADESSKPQSKFFPKKGSDDSGSDSEWESDEEESSISSEDDGVEDLRKQFFKKREDVKDVKAEPKKKEKKKEKTGDEKKRKKEKDEEEEREQVEEKRTGKPKLFQKSDELSHSEVLNKVYEILAMRGKRKIQRSEQLKMLNEILLISNRQNLGPAMEIKILLGIITSLFDYNPNTQLCIKQSLWLRCLKYIILLLEKLSANPDISIGEDIPEEKESYAKAPFMINGCIVTIIERMDTEFTRILQAADAHSPEYVDKLRFENIVNKIITRLQQYLEEKKATTSDLCRSYLLRIVHLYYKYDKSLLKSDENETKEQQNDQPEKTAEVEQPTTTTTEQSTETPATTTETPVVNGEQVPATPQQGKKQVDKLKELQITVKESNESSLQLMDRLCRYIYTHDTTDRIRTQAILYHIYHHALHDNWFEARDLMLMSQLQHNIVKADIPLHIIYNRALVQLGLCAFRHGYIREAHQDLLDIHIQSRAKELLAQGILPKNQERTLEQEKEEKQRLLPFHMHINLELLECAYLVSAMLLEIPDVAANEYNVRKKIITRPFYNQLRKNEEQSLIGVPESMREHVIAASKAMRIGNWKQCQEYVINEKMNNKVWNLFHQPNKVREMLKHKIKEESLRAYLFTYSHVYDSISLLTLSEMFELDGSTVHSIISKMIIKQELMGSLDEPTQALVMHRTEPSRIQGLSLQLMDKINHLVDFNEKIYEMKQNSGNQNKQYKRNYNDNRNDQNRNMKHGMKHNRNHHNKGGHRHNKRPNNNRNQVQQNEN